MSSAISCLALTRTASGAVAKRRFVTAAGAQAGEDVNTLGVSDTEAADGEDFAVHVLGTALVEAGAQLAANVDVASDANGRARAIDGVTYTKKAGRTLEAASGAEAVVEIFLIPN